MKVKIINNKKIVFFESFLIFILIICSFVFANIDKKVYEITNPISGYKMFINEEGKVLLESDANIKIDYIRDLFTEDVKILRKTYGMTYTDIEYTYDDYGEYEDGEYIGKNDETVEYYDLEGNKLKFDSEVIGVVGDNVIFKDGSYVNIVSNKKFKLENLKGNKTYSRYSINLFNGYIIISEIDYKLNRALYIYDKNLNLLKTIDGVTVRQAVDIDENYKDVMKEVLPVATSKFYGFNVLDKNFNLIFDGDPVYSGNLISGGYLEATYLTEEGYYDYSEFYDIKEKKIVNLGEDKITLKNDNYNLVSTICDNDKEIKLYDIQIKEVKAYKLDDKNYYEVKTDNKKRYLYDENGNRRIILESRDDDEKEYNVEYDDTELKKEVFLDIIYSDKKYIIIKDNFSKELKVYNSNLTPIISLDVSFDVAVDKFFDKYYVIYTGFLKKNRSYIFDENFKYLKSNKEGHIYIVDNEYECVFDNNVIYDEKFKVIKKFDYEVNDITSTTLSSGKKLYRVSGVGDNEYIYDCEFNKEVKLEYDELVIYDNYILIKGDSNIVKIYDLDLNKVDEFAIGNNSELPYKYVTEIKNDLVVVKEADDVYYYDSRYERIMDKRKIKFSMYKIGKGLVLKDFHYIGEFGESFFTFANGFDFGIMDYDLNEIHTYSIFNTLNIIN